MMGHTDTHTPLLPAVAVAVAVMLLQNDTKKLAEAKQLVYLKGFTDGVLVVGEYAGKKVRWGAGGGGAGGGVCVCVLRGSKEVRGAGRV